VKRFLSIIFLGASAVLTLSAAAPESRTWTPAQIPPFSGTLVNAAPDTVTIKRLPDGQVFRLKLIDCSAEDQAYVAKALKDARDAESYDAKISGEITWRLPPWNNLGWTSRQPAELWIWDEKTRTPIEKIATFDVNYDPSMKRNEFFGKYSSSGTIRLWKPAKYVIKGRFQATVNGEHKDLEQTSTPFTLPAVGKDVLQLNIVRFSLTR
jgi:hypothetical protein